ncbi:MAG: NlpC/P60 family protein [Veillonellales bacterium]
MRKFRLPTAMALLLFVSVNVITPAAPAYAAGLSDILGQTTNSDSHSSSSGLMNLLLGLLLGKILGNVNDSGSANPLSTITKTLGIDSSPAAPSGSAAPNQTQATGNTIVNTAKKYMGVPYVWGGDQPTGWDCSGFTQYVMKENGITLPRTAAEQYAAGTPVDKSRLQPGDLVFFTTYKAGASHVGFYIGSGQFIHASSAAKQVTISSLDEQYYTDHYIGARRYSK